MAYPVKENKRKKVLVIGREVSDFLCPTFQSINEGEEYEVHLLETRTQSPKQQEIERSFISQYKIGTNFKSYKKSAYFFAFITSDFWKNIFKKVSIKESIRAALVAKAVKPLFKDFDIFNIQFLTPEALYFAKFIPENKKLVLSFWGSDLFQCNDDFSYQEQNAIIRRSKKIIVHSAEMKNIFLSKFGRHLEDRVENFFLVDISQTLQRFYDKGGDKNSIIDLFRQKYQIHQDKTIVTIGHSGHDIDNHISIVNSLGQMEAQIKERCFFILPMTYGAEPEYINRVEESCRTAGMNYKIFTNFLPDEDIIGMRFSSEVVIRMSKFDAFSLSVCETICAGNIVIAATWLPYGTLRTADIYYKETDAFEKLPQIVKEVVSQKEAYLKKCSENPEKLMQLFHKQHAAQSLSKLYSQI